REALAEVNRSHQLDPLSLAISTTVGTTHILARQYDEAIVVCKKLAMRMRHSPERTFVWPMGIGGNACTRRSLKNGRLMASSPATETISEFASAMEQGFRLAGWKGALTKGIETRQTQRKTGYSSACRIAEFY